jgi:hypothetical protein
MAWFFSPLVNNLQDYISGKSVSGQSGSAATGFAGIMTVGPR